MSDESILKRLEAQGRRAPRVLLRQDGSPGAPPIETCGRYEVLGALAQGGVGEVLRGRDMDLGRDVALKVLREGHLANPDLLQRFVDEAQIGGQLQHPGIVPVYDLGLRADRRPYFAMKLVKGRTLAALLREGGKDRRRLLQVFEQVCRTVAYAHDRGVVHRDLKPSNIMVGAFGEVQILDWGFAKVLPRGGVADERRPSDVTRIATARSGLGSESLAGSVMGTPAYMPPEQALGHVDELDERSDVFSLGAILCEVLTGGPPYTGDDLLAKAAQAKLEDAHARLDASEEREMAELARRCLSPLRSARPREAGEVAEGVLRHLASVEERAQAAAIAAAEVEEEAARARRETEGQRRARRQTRRVAAAVLLAVAAGVGSYAKVDAERRERAGRAAGGIDRALLEAQRCRGAGAWAAAEAAARDAVTLARAGGVAPTLRERAEATLAAVASDAEAARQASVQQERERGLLNELDEILLASWEAIIPGQHTAEAVAAALGSRGIDLTKPAEAIARIEREWSGIRVDLASVLDTWAARVAGTAQAAPLTMIAKGIDPDPQRDRIRDAIGARDAAALRALRAEGGVETLPPRTARMLAWALLNAGARAEAEELFRDLWLRSPDDFLLNACIANLASAHGDPKRSDATRFAQAAVALRPQSAFAWHRLAHVREGRGDLTGARDALRRACSLDPGERWHPVCLSCFEETDDGIALLRDVILRWPDFAFAHNNLGALLGMRGDRKGAIAAAREAVRLEPAVGLFRHGLGASLYNGGDLSGAIAELREAVRLRPGQAGHQYSLGLALSKAGDPEAGIPALREAIRLDPRMVDAHLTLAWILQEQGRYLEGLESARRTNALLSEKGSLPADQQQRLDVYERRAALEERLPRIVQGEDAPRDALERIELADICMKKGRVDDAVRLFERTLGESPAWIDRYNAACVAAFAAGKGGEQSARYRSLALGWLRSALSALEATGDAEAAQRLRNWKSDEYLASVRDRLEDLPEAERGEWKKLWADVDALLAQATR